MECEFHLQDPTAPDTVYLFEAIVEAADGAESCAGLFAFASRAGVDCLIRDPAIQSFLRNSTMSLLVGIDAITNRETLEHLRELEQHHERLSVQVFRNPTNALFHPKVVQFGYPDGRQSMIVGSGNLTPGGLRGNFEAFNVVRAAANDALDLSSWNRFFTTHAVNIGAIDEAALERAARNVVRGHQRLRDAEAEPGTQRTAATNVELPVPLADRFLVAQVPGGDRWTQVGFNIEVIRNFFRVEPHTSQRVYLVECRPDNTFAEPEPPRPCVYSPVNRNHRIEIAARPGAPYPDEAEGRPIAVFRELQTRSFAYMLLMPGEPGYGPMMALTDNLESVGRGLRRVIADATDIRGAWPECPLVTSIDTLAGTGA